MRMVPASTSRRNPATMSGTRTSTAAGIATTRSHWGIIDTSLQRCAAYSARADVRNRTTVAATIDVFNSQHIAGTHPGAGEAIFGTQRREQLHDLAVDINGHQAAAVRVEPRDRAHFVLETALQR